MDRREFIHGMVAVGATGAPAAATAALPQRPAAELHGRLAAGSLQATALVADCLARIDEIDRRGPALRTLISINPDAAAIAAALDERQRRGDALGPLHGMPVVLKDNIATGDPMPTTMGSLALDSVRCHRDAALVRRLREAGAVILGKSNLTEWCNARSPNATAGWSATGGLTRNPHVLDRVCGGSSSGSAAAVAAGLVPLAVGTETDGSIVCPASICGLVGVKPTLGWCDLAGVLTISEAQDVAGPLARSVRDAALLLDAMAGAAQARPVTPQLQPGALQGRRLGIAAQHLVRDPAARAVFDRALQLLRDCGATLVEVRIPNRGSYGDSSGRLMMHGFKAHLQAWLADYAVAPPIRNLAELIAFNKAHAAREMALFGQEVLEHIERQPLLSPAAVRDARANLHRLAGTEGLDAVLKLDRLDALIGITSVPGWPADPSRRPRPDPGFTTPAAAAGYPHVTVPAGHAGLLPVGLSFVGTAWSEPQLLAMAHDFEQAAQAWRAPSFAAAQA